MKKQIVIEQTGTINKEINIEKTESVNFINGTFTPTDAREILLAVFRSKINFHNLRNWSSEERFGKPDLDSTKRLVALKETKAFLEELIKKADEEGRKLTVESTINISLTA